MRLSKKLERYFNKTYSQAVKEHSEDTIKDIIILAEHVDYRKFDIEQDAPELKGFYNVCLKHQNYKFEIACYDVIEKYLRAPMALTSSGHPMYHTIRGYDNFFKSLLKKIRTFDQSILNWNDLQIILEAAYNIFVKTYPKLKCPIDPDNDLLQI